MPILNENLDWNQIVKNNVNAQQAFLRTPVKTLLSQNQMLCRFITTQLNKENIRDSGIFSSPWWTDWNGTIQMLSRWKTAQASTKDVLRGKLAITSEFSAELDSLVQIVLTKPVYGWKGIARYQDDNNIKVTYIGGAMQLYVPNLAANPMELTSNVAYLHCFSSVDSLG